MAKEEIEKLKKQIENEKQKLEEADEVKKLNKELLRLQHKKAAKAADLLQDLPKILYNGLLTIGKAVPKIVEGLNKMDEKVVEMQKKENETKGKQSQVDELNKEELNLLP